MPRVKLRSRREVVERCHAPAATVREGLERLPQAADDPGVAEAVWAGEGLGVLLWALDRAQMPPFDRPFRAEDLLETSLEGTELRPEDEVVRARDAARLWHWRARTLALQDADGIELPGPWQSFDQLVAATAMRAYEQGLLPRPLRGDFPAFGTVYRDLSDEQRAEAHNIAWERHRALNWLCGLGKRWDETPTDT